jgi:glycosyltransferase involved in cell wall biosynthesis
MDSSFAIRKPVLGLDIQVGRYGTGMIDVILPALNEAAALPEVLGRIVDGFRPIVVDNGSTDSTGAVAASLGARVVVEPHRGFGAACLTGLRSACSDVVCFMDCDGSLDAADLPRVATPVQQGTADLVLGARCPTTRRAWPVHARLANRALARMVNRRWDLSLSDLGPMRASRRAELLDLDLSDLRFGLPLEMVVRAARRSWTIAEVPVAYRPRVGESKVTGTLRGTARSVRDMVGALR